MLLKEDGHLDVEKVKSLNKEELNLEMKSWGLEQLEDFLREQPIAETTNTRNYVVEFDGTLEEFLEKFC